MYDLRPNLLIGFHGCDRNTARLLLNDPVKIKMSKRPYDWLGHGMYFWENNLELAGKWAIEKQQRKGGPIEDATVVGAVLNLGYCCDLTDSRYINMLKDCYYVMKKERTKVSRPILLNKDIPADPHKDKLLRLLDCAVIETLHELMEEQFKADIKTNGFSELNIFDSTRCFFTEGGRIYEGSGFFEKTHVQICIRNPNCIKGFFNPRAEINFPQSKISVLN